MKKILFTATLIGTLLSCTTQEPRENSELLAMADYRMELPTVTEQVGFENVLSTNVNFQYVSENTNALAALENLPRDKKYTMLAPMDYAFAKAQNPETFMLANYIIEGAWTRQNINEALSINKTLRLKTLSGMELAINKTNDKLYVSNGNREIELVFTDLETESNTLHVVSELW